MGRGMTAAGSGLTRPLRPRWMLLPPTKNKGPGSSEVGAQVRADGGRLFAEPDLRSFLGYHGCAGVDLDLSDAADGVVDDNRNQSLHADRGPSQHGFFSQTPW